MARQPTPSITAAEINDLKAQMDKATKGPWILMRGLLSSYPGDIWRQHCPSLFRRRENVELAVAAVNALPGLLGRIEQLETHFAEQSRLMPAM